MKIIILASLVLFSTSTFSSEIRKTIEYLGLTFEDFTYIWTSEYCGDGSYFSLSKDTLSDESLLGYRAIKANFWTAKNLKDNEYTVSQGKICKELYQYIYEGQKDVQLNSKFLLSDARLISEYGYSSIFLWYLKEYSYFSQNGELGEVSEFKKKLVQLDLFHMKKSKSTFNGKPSIAIEGFLTDKGEALRNTLMEK